LLLGLFDPELLLSFEEEEYDEDEDKMGDELAAA